MSTVQIGRGQENQVVIQDPRSSRRHCRIVKTAKGFVLEDLKSRNGTLLKGQRVGRSILNVGDVFQIGKTRFHFGQKPGVGNDGGSDAPGDGGSEVPGPAVAASPAEAKPALASKPAPADARAVPVEEVYLEGLAGLYEGQRVPITKSTYTIGRKDDNDFRLEDRRASGYHAKLHCRDDAFYLVDLDSKNGTFVNGRAIKKEVRLSRGARLQIGDCQFRVHVPGPAVEEEDSDAFVDASGDYDFSRFDVDEFLQDSGGAGQPLVAVGLLVILGAVLYFVVDLSLRTVRRTNPDPNHQTNQILSNWSFEDAPAEDGEIPGWVVPTGDAARIAIEESSGVKYPGSRALALAGGGTGDEGWKLQRAIYHERVSISGADDDASRYYISGGVLNRGSLGAGLMVRWLREVGDDAEEVGRAYTNAVIQVDDDEEVGRWISPPRSARYAELSCFVLGGTAVFDQIHFGRERYPDADESLALSESGESDDTDESEFDDRESDEGEGGEGYRASVPTAASMEPARIIVELPSDERDRGGPENALPIQAVLYPDGTLREVRRGRLPLIAALWPGLTPQQDPLGLGPRLSTHPFFGGGAFSGGGGRQTRLSCQVPDLLAGEWHPLELHVEEDSGDLTLRYRYRRVSAHDLPEKVGVYIELASRDRGLSAFGREGIVDLGGEQLSDPVAELVIGEGAEQIVCRFDPPLRFETVSPVAGRGWTLAGTSADLRGGLHDVSVVLSRTSRQEQVVVRAMINRARESYRKGELADATSTLKEVLARYPWRTSDAVVVESILKEWSAEGDRALSRLEADFAILKETPSELVYENLIASSGEFLGRHKGTDAATPVEEKLAEIRMYRDERLEGRQGRQLASIFERGQDHYRKGEYCLAEFFLRRVRESVNDTELIQQIDNLLTLIDKKTERKRLFGD